MAAATLLRAPRATDVVIAVAGAAVGIGILLLLPVLASDATPTPTLPVAGSGLWWLVATVILVQGALLAWARHAPAVALGGVSAVAFVLAVTMPGAVLDAAALAIGVAVFVVFLAAPSRRLWEVLAASVVLTLVGNLVNAIVAEGTEPLGALGEAAVQTAGIFGVPLLLAMVLRSRRESREAQHSELRALTRERDARVDATVARERTAMARELHDIAAHHLSGIALMSSAMERQVATDPDAARESARAIRAESTAVLQNLRRVVGLLRDDGVGERSVESLASLADLVDRAGAPVRLATRKSGSDAELGAGIGPLAQLAAYRTVQEALSNAARHAPGAASVVELDDSDPAAVLIRVTSGPPLAPVASSPRGGFGLIGMRERAELIGAELGYGPTPDGGWSVRLSIPREGTA